MKLVESEEALSINDLKAELGLEGSGYSVAVNGTIHAADLHNNDLSAFSPYLVTFSPQVKGAHVSAPRQPLKKAAKKVAKKVVTKKAVAKGKCKPATKKTTTRK